MHEQRTASEILAVRRDIRRRIEDDGTVSDLNMMTLVEMVAMGEATLYDMEQVCPKWVYETICEETADWGL